MHIDVREEEASDPEAIRAVNKRAFGQDHEADIVDALRSNGATSLSLVATVDSLVAGHVVGHIPTGILARRLASSVRIAHRAGTAQHSM